MNDDLIMDVISISSIFRQLRYNYPGFTIDNLIIDNPDSKNPTFCNIFHKAYTSQIIIESSDGRKITYEYKYFDFNYGAYTEIRVYVDMDSKVFICRFNIDNDDLYDYYKSIEKNKNWYNERYEIYDRETRTSKSYFHIGEEEIKPYSLTKEELEIIKNAMRQKVRVILKEELEKELIRIRGGYC